MIDALETTSINFSSVTQDGAGFTGKLAGDLLASNDPNFRPVDLEFAPDGSLYFIDWHNPLIGHMQHNARDPQRDHDHGRIYRITAEGRPLQQPVAIAGQPIPALLENLKHPVDGVRHRTRVELSARDTKEVIAAAQTWVKQFDPNKKEDAHHLLEALWLLPTGAWLERALDEASIAATLVRTGAAAASPPAAREPSSVAPAYQTTVFDTRGEMLFPRSAIYASLVIVTVIVALIALAWVTIRAQRR